MAPTIRRSTTLSGRSAPLAFTVIHVGAEGRETITVDHLGREVHDLFRFRHAAAAGADHHGAQYQVEEDISLSGLSEALAVIRPECKAAPARGNPSGLPVPHHRPQGGSCQWVCKRHQAAAFSLSRFAPSPLTYATRSATSGRSSGASRRRKRCSAHAGSSKITARRVLDLLEPPRDPVPQSHRRERRLDHVRRPQVASIYAARHRRRVVSESVPCGQPARACARLCEWSWRGKSGWNPK